MKDPLIAILIMGAIALIVMLPSIIYAFKHRNDKDTSIDDEDTYSW